MKIINVDGVDYAPVSEMKNQEPSGDYVIVRSCDAGVFAGNLVEHDRSNKVAVLQNSKRLWRWEGAASLSQLSVDGVSKPEDCKFAKEIVGDHTIANVCEIIPCTEKAKNSIDSVKEWDANE